MTDCEFQRSPWKGWRDWGKVSDWVKFWNAQCTIKFKKLSMGDNLGDLDI